MLDIHVEFICFKKCYSANQKQKKFSKFYKKSPNLGKNIQELQMFIYKILAKTITFFEHKKVKNEIVNTKNTKNNRIPHTHHEIIFKDILFVTNDKATKHDNQAVRVYTGDQLYIKDDEHIHY